MIMKEVQIALGACLLGAAWCLSGCLIDFTEAIPCDDASQCPASFTCDEALSLCVQAGDEPSNNSPVNNAPVNNSPGDGDAGVGVDVEDDVVAPPSDVGMVDMGDPTPDVPVGPDTDGPEPDVPVNPGECAENMVLIGNIESVAPFCIDIYEASRPDADTGTAGVDNSRATSRPGVLPWSLVNLGQATQACQAAGKRLCTIAEWTAGCGGPDNREYPYSAMRFVEGQCNASGTVATTGGHPDCRFPDYGTLDMSGNVIEIVDNGMGTLSLKGGAFSDVTPSQLTCNGPARPQAPPAQIGFRCCSDAP